MAVANVNFGIDDEFGAPALTDLVTGQKKPLVDAPGVGKPAVTKFRKEIDLKDGSGVQVFEADTQEALIDKLVQAQENATRKIQELSQKKREWKPEKIDPIVEFKPKQLSSADILALSNEWGVDPVAAFRKLSEATFGASPEVVAENLNRVQRLARERQEQDAALEFMADHDEYVPNPKNGAALERFLKAEGLPVTRNNLEYAYQNLLEANQIQTVKSTVTAVVEPPDKTKEIEPPPAVLSDRMSAGSPAPTGTDLGAVAAELQTLPIDQARDRIVSILRQQKSQAAR